MENLNNKQFENEFNELLNSLSTGLNTMSESVNKASYLVANRIIESQDFKLISLFGKVYNHLPRKMQPIYTSFISDFSKRGIHYNQDKQAFTLAANRKELAFDFKVNFNKVANKKPQAKELSEEAQAVQKARAEVNRLLRVKLGTLEKSGLSKAEAYIKLAELLASKA